MPENDTDKLEHQISASTDPARLCSEPDGTIPQMTVSQYLDQLITEHGLSKSDIVNRSNLERSYAYHILSGDKALPSRPKILALALAMQLSHKEVQRLLYYSKHEHLYVKNKWDAIIWYAISKKLSPADANIILSDLSMLPLLE